MGVGRQRLRGGGTAFDLWTSPDHTALPNGSANRSIVWLVFPDGLAERVDRYINRSTYRPPGVTAGPPPVVPWPWALDAREGARPGTLTGVDGEVSGRGNLRGASVGRPKALPTPVSRSVGVYSFGRWALGERWAFGRWVLGRWVLGARQGHPREDGRAA